MNSDADHFRLRVAALIAVLVGAVGSLAFMFRVGRRNESALLMIAFALWVLSPFVAMARASQVSKRWSALTRATLHIIILILTPGSLLIYGNVAFGAPRPQPAFMFLVVPFASWLLIAVGLSIAACISRASQK